MKDKIFFPLLNVLMLSCQSGTEDRKEMSRDTTAIQDASTENFSFTHTDKYRTGFPTSKECVFKKKE